MALFPLLHGRRMVEREGGPGNAYQELVPGVRRLL